MLVALHLVLGSVWIARNLGNAPRYGDTVEYLAAARELRVDDYRGLAYPALIVAEDRLLGWTGLGARAYLRALQVFQFVCVWVGLAYFVRVLVLTPSAPRGSRVLAGVLPLLLLFDPLVAHFSLAVMTDGLALSACLIFCAALADFGLGRSSRVWSGALVLVGFALAASLRVEKLVVLPVAALATAVCWWLLERGRASQERSFGPARAAQLAGILLAGTLAILAARSNSSGDGRRWPLYESVLHQRVVYPNLGVVYDELGKGIRSRVSRRVAELHDEHLLKARKVINTITGADSSSPKRAAAADGVRRALLEEGAAVVLRERWPRVAADVLGDAAENVAPTLSFFARLGLDDSPLDPREPVMVDEPRLTYELLACHSRELSPFYVGSAGLLYLFTAVLAVGAVLRRRARNGPRRIERGSHAAWVPVGAFVLVNACAFALAADLVSVRYALVAHAVFLVLAYRGALAWLLEDETRAERLETAQVVRLEIPLGHARARQALGSSA